MNRRQARTLLSLYAVDVFLEANKDRLPVATSTGTRDRFGRTLAELELHVRTQAVSPIVAEGLTRAKDAKREALLRDHLAPIARVARLEATRFPDLAPLKMPRGEPGVAKLLAHAAGMARVAREHAGVFISAGLRQTFVEDLEFAIADIEATVTERRDRRGMQAGASRGVKAAMASCRRYKAVLQAFVEREAHSDARLLAHWRSVQRVGGAGRQPKRATGGDRLRLNGQVGQVPIVDPNRLLAAPSRLPLSDEETGADVGPSPRSPHYM